MDYEAYQTRLEKVVKQYGKNVAPVARGSKYMEVVQKNTSRLQGSLVLLGYEMCNGSNEDMIEKAALAIELLHAYIQCTQQAVDTTQALRGQHEAEIILANLEVEPEYRIKALSITNRTMMLANLAQLTTTSPEDTVQWQATELVLNPIHVGQVLAGSECDANNAVTPLATHVGKQLAAGNEIDKAQLFTQLREITW